MTTSPTIQVLRYSALVAGLVYGVYHQSSITSSAKQAEAEREYARQERLIQQAKAEWKKKTQPQNPQTQNSGGMIGEFRVPCASEPSSRPPWFSLSSDVPLIIGFSSHHGSRRQPVRPGGLLEDEGWGELDVKRSPGKESRMSGSPGCGLMAVFSGAKTAVGVDPD